MTGRGPALVMALAAAAALAACDLGVHDPSSDPAPEPGASSACSGACHGAGGEAAPPRDTAGRSDASAIGVGAHRQHLAGSDWHRRVECGACHRVPEQIGDPGHLDGALPAELIFDGMGAGGVWNRDSQTCASTYCHGATLSSTVGDATGGGAGGATTEPRWTLIDRSQVQCGSCHGAPPPAPHPDDADCGRCHPTMNRGAGLVIGYPELHIDGHVDVIDAAACDGCHGAAGQPAPPRDTTGQTATTARGVGAHAQHLIAASPWHAPIGCRECHAVPAGVNDQGHLDSALPAELVFGPLAGAASRWNGTTCTSTYCHGGGPLTGGAATAPVWTRVDGTQSRCGSCHGAPPPPPHPAGADCGACHPTMTPGGGLVIGYPELHLDGKVDLIADQPCDACHGASGNPAPPRDTTGGTTTDLRTVGAHRNHLAPASWRRDIACDACHRVPAAVTSIGHLDTARPAELTFAPIAGAARWTGATCVNTYCHGATLTGGSSTDPVWTTVNGAQGQCGSCHGTPPPPPHPSDADCGRCHDTMTAGGGLMIADPARHIDGNLDVAGDQACNACHGGDTSAPPRDLAGNTATTARGVGAHQRHLATTGRFAPVACGDCHRVPATVSAVGHLDSALPAELVFSLRAGPTTAWSGARCSNSYCHGATLAAGGAATAPLWTTVDGSQATCASCHGNPPPLPHPQNSDCGQCHRTVQPGSPTTFVDPLRHVDGTLDVDASQACNACHGGGNNAPPRDTAGNTATTARGVGAHQAHVTGAGWHRDVACGDCHRVPAATGAAGHLDTPLPAELVFSGIAAGSTWTGSTCTSYCHGSTLGAGGGATAPVWTRVDGTQKQCASCHGDPPPAPHPQDASCERCHPDAAAGGAFAVPGQHIDGVLQVTAVHPPGYAAREAHGHDFDRRGSATCATASCHGAALTGGAGPSCESCHASWQTRCTFCHGGPAGSTGAPPQGVEGQTAASDRHVGAHARHAGATATHAAWSCAYCHTAPSGALTPGHVDGAGGVVQAELTYSSLNPAASYSPATATCSNLYCHGNGRTSTGTASWTSTTALTCSSCHATNGSGMSGRHSRHIRDEGIACARCHSTVVDSARAIIDPALHVDGIKQVKLTVGAWSPASRSCSGLGGGCHGTETW